MHPTFHYESGLLARRPAGKELEAFNVWRHALDAYNDAGVTTAGRFLREDEVKAIADVRGAMGVFGRSGEREAWLYILDPLDRQGLDRHSVTWVEPWQPKGEWPIPDAGARLANAVRKQ